MGFLLFLLLIAGAAVFFFRNSYNGLGTQRENVKESFSNISVVMRKKLSLINQLGQVVSNVSESEKLVVLQLSADSVQAVQNATTQSGLVMAEIGRMAQKYPELKSNQQYSRLMDSIQVTEGEVQNVRLVYNSNAKNFNVLRNSIPAVFFASALGFGPAPYLSLENEESDDAKVQQPMQTDDSERINALLGVAGKKALTAARQIGEQGMLLAEKGAARIQAAGAPEQFHYVDGLGKPAGPVTRPELDMLFQQGAITAETSVMSLSTKVWTTYGGLNLVPATAPSAG